MKISGARVWGCRYIGGPLPLQPSEMYVFRWKGGSFDFRSLIKGNSSLRVQNLQTMNRHRWGAKKPVLTTFRPHQAANQRFL